MKKNKPKLALNRETIKNLQLGEGTVVGGRSLADTTISGTGCPTQGVCSTAAFSVCYTQCGGRSSECAGY
jgi:hypothetical protein